MKKKGISKEKIIQIENIIGYVYKDKNNLIKALTHSSYANELKSLNNSNERLEFLGDAVLELVISEYIFINYNRLPEGEMTKIRSNIACSTTLSKCAEAIKLGEFILLGRGEELTGGRERLSILSDSYEVIIGSIYIDGGLQLVKDFILSNMKNTISDCIEGKIFLDYKTKLQEVVHKFINKPIKYIVVREQGPDHDKKFVSQVFIGDKMSGEGEGSTKKESEQLAAKKAIKGI